MVIKQDAMRTEQKEKMRGGSGTVEIRHMMPDESFDGHGRMYAIITLNPGCSIGWHEHIGESESYVMLSGTAKLNDNGKEVILETGDCAVCADGEGHAVENCGTEPVRIAALILYGKGINK